MAEEVSQVAQQKDTVEIFGMNLPKWVLSTWFIIVTFLVPYVGWIVGIILIIVRVNNNKATTATALQDTGMDISKTIKAGGATIYIDDKNKSWAYQKNGGAGLQKYKFSDLLSFEVYENGDSVMQGKAGGAIIGGLAFGIVGAMVGSAGKRKVKNTCNSLQVRMTINDLQNPEIIIPFIKHEVQKSSFTYKKSLEAAKNLAATLTYIQKQPATK